MPFTPPSTPSSMPPSRPSSQPIPPLPRRTPKAAAAYALRPHPGEPTEYSAECVDCGGNHSVDGMPVAHLRWMIRHSAETGHTVYATVEARVVTVAPLDRLPE